MQDETEEGDAAGVEIADGLVEGSDCSREARTGSYRLILRLNEVTDYTLYSTLRTWLGERGRTVSRTRGKSPLKKRLLVHWTVDLISTERMLRAC